MIGAIEPGTHLTMRGLADALALSPTPIREAVRRLSSEHALQILPNRRMSVPHMTLGRFEELIALRITLESHAATRSLPYISDIVIEKMESIDKDMDQMIRAEHFDQLTISNQQFHHMLYAVNPNQVGIPAIESVWLQLGPFQRHVLTRVSEFYVTDWHKEILSALKSRDAAALVLAIEGDIRDGISRSGRHILMNPD
jgi:DNA-binding GntR family transcriptional regulator